MELIKPDGSSATHDANGVKLLMPYVATWSVSAMVNARNTDEARLAIQRAVSLNANIVPHIVGIESNAAPIPPEQLAEMMAAQSKMSER